MTARLEIHHGKGYPRWRVWDPEEGREVCAAVHQLLAIAHGADPRLVFSGGEFHVHHVKSIPLLNTPWNLELRHNEEHGRFHLHDEEMDPDAVVWSGSGQETPA